MFANVQNFIFIRANLDNTDTIKIGGKRKMTPHNEDVDERGTTPAQARAMLQKLRDDAFDGNDEKVALALGRTQQEIFDVLHGDAEFDDDLFMKVRGIAQQRNVSLE